MSGLVSDGNVGGLLKNVAHGAANSAAKVTGSLSYGIRSAHQLIFFQFAFCKQKKNIDLPAGQTILPLFVQGIILLSSFQQLP